MSDEELFDNVLDGMLDLIEALAILKDHCTSEDIRILAGIGVMLHDFTQDILSEAQVAILEDIYNLPSADKST